MAKSLFKFSMLMRNLSSLSKCTSTMRFCHNSSDLKALSIETKEELKDVNIEEPNNKQLFEILKDDGDLSRLMENLELYKTKIDSRHVVVALTTMHKYFEKNAMSNAEVQTNEHFLRMCSILNNHLTCMELPQIIQSLKILNFLKVSSSSMIVQSLLQLIRHSINDLALHQIYYLSYFFKLIEPTPLSSAINVSLPAVFISQLNLKLDKDDIKELENALRYVSNNISNNEVIQYVLDSLSDNMDPMDSSTALDILYSLLKIKNTSNSYYDNLNRVQNIILNEPGPLPEQMVLNVLIKLCTLIIDGQEQHYNAVFLDKLISYIINDNYSFTKGAFVLNILNKFNYINIPLLKYLSKICVDNPSTLAECSPLGISTLATGLAFANFKPPDWNKLQEIIVNNSNRVVDDVTLCYLALRLVSLDCFSTKLLDYIFNMDQKPELMSYHYYQTLKRLYIIVKILHPTYSGTWPSKQLISSFQKIETKKPKLNPLLPALEKIFKNPLFIKSQMKTYFGHEIDHLVVLQNGSPIIVEPKDSKITSYIEDLEIPQNSEKIALLFLPNKAFGKNIPIMESSFASYIKSLEALSYTVAYVSEKSWRNMYDYERLPYLRYLLKLPPTKNENKPKNKRVEHNS